MQVSSTECWVDGFTLRRSSLGLPGVCIYGAVRCGRRHCHRTMTTGRAGPSRPRLVRGTQTARAPRAAQQLEAHKPTSAECSTTSALPEHRCQRQRPKPLNLSSSRGLGAILGGPGVRWLLRRRSRYIRWSACGHARMSAARADAFCDADRRCNPNVTSVLVLYSIADQIQIGTKKVRRCCQPKAAQQPVASLPRSAWTRILSLVGPHREMPIGHIRIQILSQDSGVNMGPRTLPAHRGFQTRVNPHWYQQRRESSSLMHAPSAVSTA